MRNVCAGGSLLLAIIVFALPAHAERWPKAGYISASILDNRPDDYCVDVDSVKTGKDCVTFYLGRECDSKSSATEFRVKCSQKFGEQFTLSEKVPDIPGEKPFTWHTSQAYSRALVGQAAKFVCHK